MGLAGELIRDIFGAAETIADLHACLTSPRGDFFRLRLLQQMEIPLGGVGRKAAEGPSLGSTNTTGTSTC